MYAECLLVDACIQSASQPWAPLLAPVGVKPQTTLIHIVFCSSLWLEDLETFVQQMVQFSFLSVKWRRAEVNSMRFYTWHKCFIFWMFFLITNKLLNWSFFQDNVTYRSKYLHSSPAFYQDAVSGKLLQYTLLLYPVYLLHYTRWSAAFDYSQHFRGLHFCH